MHSGSFWGLSEPNYAYRFCLNTPNEVTGSLVTAGNAYFIASLKCNDLLPRGKFISIADL